MWRALEKWHGKVAVLMEVGYGWAHVGRTCIGVGVGVGMKTLQTSIATMR